MGIVITTREWENGNQEHIPTHLATLLRVLSK